MWQMPKKFSCTENVTNLIEALLQALEAKATQSFRIREEFAFIIVVKGRSCVGTTSFSSYFSAMVLVRCKVAGFAVH